MEMELPHGTSLTYFAEGAANVVYRIGIPASSTMDDILPSEIDYYSPATPQPTELEPWQVDVGEADFSYLKGKLLRLRKDLPAATSVTEAHRDYLDYIAPLFEEQELVTQELIQVPGEMIDQLNSVLRSMDEGGHRPQKRRGIYLAEVEYGHLVQDMSSRPGQGLLTIETKPKWLLQSPNAPARAKRCRTCALRASRVAHEASNKKAIATSQAFCPLGLVSGKEANVSRAVQEILKGSSNAELLNESIQQRLVAYFLESSLLAKLRSLQQKLDPKGILQSNALDSDLLTAMTLRDCTLYLKVVITILETKPA